MNHAVVAVARLVARNCALAFVEAPVGNEALFTCVENSGEQNSQQRSHDHETIHG